MSEIDIADFRRALGQFPTGVTVITTRDAQGQPVGMTASSFNSVSLDPPLVLWSIERSAYGADVFRNASHFAVNVLGKQQAAISNQFARRGGDKFAGIEFCDGEGGCPVLTGTAANFQCSLWQCYEGGDHLILVGEVQAYSHSANTMPLVFARGSYAVSAPQTVSAGNLQQDSSASRFLPSFLLYQLNRVYTAYAAELYSLLMTEFEISGEEWRILTFLAASGDFQFQTLAEAVAQPYADCRDALVRLSNRGYVCLSDDEIAQLSDAGRVFTDQLLEFARNHEQTVTARLPEQDRERLGASLQTLSNSFSAN